MTQARVKPPICSTNGWTHAISALTRLMCLLWRKRNGHRCEFWRALPPKGKIGIFFGSWYTAPMTATGFHRLCFKLVDVTDEIGNETIPGKPYNLDGSSTCSNLP